MGWKIPEKLNPTMGQTRVNLRHLLEDIRDSYPYMLEETIISEIVANALDAGARTISFFVNPDTATFTVVDDGAGMTRRAFELYHDIAMSTKVRGKGIGFAGIGAKLAILISQEVYTETRHGNFHGASRWHLEDDYHAPWVSVSPDNLVSGESGTAVRLLLKSEDSPLLDTDFIIRAIQRHFEPLFSAYLTEEIYTPLYGGPVRFWINGEQVPPPPHMTGTSRMETFQIRGGRRKGSAGAGILFFSEDPLPEDDQGIAIATYGKVIRRGWEWLQLFPPDRQFIRGVVEVPALAKILTLNKADFLKDPTSLAYYYRYRRQIQQAIQSVLTRSGILSFLETLRPRSSPRPLVREVRRVLGTMIGEFPELRPIVGRIPMRPGRGSRKQEESGRTGDGQVADNGISLELLSPEEEIREIEMDPEVRLPADEKEQKNTTGEKNQEDFLRSQRLTIAFEHVPDRPELGWLRGTTLVINTGHPAYLRAHQSHAEAYHIMLTVGWILANHLEPSRSPQQFLAQFLYRWGESLLASVSNEKKAESR